MGGVVGRAGGCRVGRSYSHYAVAGHPFCGVSAPGCRVGCLNGWCRAGVWVYVMCWSVYVFVGVRFGGGWRGGGVGGGRGWVGWVWPAVGRWSAVRNWCLSWGVVGVLSCCRMASRAVALGGRGFAGGWRSVCLVRGAWLPRGGRADPGGGPWALVSVCVYALAGGTGGSVVVGPSPAWHAGGAPGVVWGATMGGVAAGTGAGRGGGDGGGGIKGGGGWEGGAGRRA